MGIQNKYKNEVDRKERKLAAQKKYKNSHRSEGTAYARKKNYGVTQEEYDAKVRRQNNRCAVCGEAEIRRNHWQDGSVMGLSVDHDHETGKIRDLLCYKCNIGLGMFGDSVAVLEKALQYLKGHKEHGEDASS